MNYDGHNTIPMAGPCIRKFFNGHVDNVPGMMPEFFPKLIWFPIPMFDKVGNLFAQHKPPLGKKRKNRHKKHGHGPV
eukprot:11570049-Karenia_brevis.AAC.1